MRCGSNIRGRTPNWACCVVAGRPLATSCAARRTACRCCSPDGDTDTLTRLYEGPVSIGSLNGLAARAVLAAVTARPYRPVRILEIGAGTGGLTSAILPLLPAAEVTYLFTDIGRLFVTRAATRFAAYPCMTYAVLDIARPLEGQGVPLGAFDIVVAANVLARDPGPGGDARSGACPVRRPMAPWLLLEVTAPRAWIDVIFGTTDGWWAFADRHLRAAHPLLSASAWEELLTEFGFAAASRPNIAAQAAALSPQAVIMATRAPDARPAELLAAAQGAAGGGCWWLLSDDAELSGQVAAGLAERGAEVAVGALPAAGAVNVLCLYTGTPASPADAATAASLAVLEVVQALSRRAGPARLWLVTRGAQAVEPGETLPGVAGAALWGLGKVVALEHAELSCRRVDLDPAEPAAEQLLAELALGGDEEEVAWRHGVRFAARLVRRPAPPTQPARLAQARRGTLDELTFEPLRRRPPGPGEVELRVEAAGVNFRDVLNALDQYPGDAGPLGDECVGEVVGVGPGAEIAIGSRVAALVGGSFADYVTVPASLVAPVPAGMAAVAAAALPLAWATARAALLEAAGLTAGEHVLVHAASGGVGQALVRLAQQCGAAVLGTASPAKWPVLRRLGIASPLNSRVPRFAEAVQSQTGGRGVDVVVNCLAGPFIAEGLAALAPGGRFVELGKSGIWTAEQVASVRPDATYRVVDLLARRRRGAGGAGGRTARGNGGGGDAGGARADGAAAARGGGGAAADAAGAARWQAGAGDAGGVVASGGGRGLSGDRWPGRAGAAGGGVAAGARRPTRGADRPVRRRGG